MSETVTFTFPVENKAESLQQSIPRRLGQVTIEQQIGQGASGVVFRARHEILGRDVAVKFLLHAMGSAGQSQFESFRAEARAAAAVRHPHLTMIHHADIVDGIPYLVMDYVDGPSLNAAIKKNGRLSVPAALAASIAMADAVSALHKAGIIHRDIKSKNALLDREGNVLITDFGLALARMRSGSSMSPHGLAGTPAYMAPEMFEGLISERSDVYALGITSYEMLVGSLPFYGAIGELRAQHAGSPIPGNRMEAFGVPLAMVEIIERATHKNAAYRYKSAGHLLQALQAASTPQISQQGKHALKQLSMCREEVAEPQATDLSAENVMPVPYFTALGEFAHQRRAVRFPARISIMSPGKSVAAGDPRWVLRLRRCPRCGYDLKTLPARHRCPECGFEYDENMCCVYGFTWKDRFSVGGRLLKGRRFEKLFALGLLCTFGMLFVFWLLNSWSTGVWSFPILLCLILWGSISRLRALRDHETGMTTEGRTQLFIAPEGVSIRTGPGEEPIVPWRVVRNVRMRPIKFHKNLWLLRLRLPFWRWFRQQPIELLIECTRREAAMVRNEIRRRLRSATAQPAVSAAAQTL